MLQRGRALPPIGSRLAQFVLVWSLAKTPGSATVPAPVGMMAYVPVMYRLMLIRVAGRVPWPFIAAFEFPLTR